MRYRNCSSLQKRGHQARTEVGSLVEKKYPWLTRHTHLESSVLNQHPNNHNQMLLHHKARDYERALQFGYLSIRAKNHDYLLYVNNLCDVLVQLGRYEEGLELLRGAAKEAKDTNNYFNRVGFVAFYMRCQIGVGQARSAVSYGSSFLAAYKKEILKYRWYRFFRTYLEALLRTDQSREMLRLLKKHRLLEMEAEKGLAAGKIPAFKVLAHTARYLAGDLGWTVHDCFF